MTTCDFLLIGCEGCGKTTMLKQLINMSKNSPADETALNTLPTNGVELETITYKKHKYVVREIGGNFLPVWSKYYESALMVIFMVDMANHSQLPITCVEFLNLLCHKGLYKKSFLLLLNKIDQPYAMTRTMLDQILFLEAAKKEAYMKYGQSIWVEEISAAKGLGLDKVLFWMHDTKRSLSHSFSPGVSPKNSPKGSPKGPSNSPMGPSSSPKGVHLQPTSFIPSYANNTIYEHLRINQANQYNNPPSNAINTNINTNSNTPNHQHLPSPITTTTTINPNVAIAKQKEKIPYPRTSSLSVLYHTNTNNSPPSTSTSAIIHTATSVFTALNSNTNNMNTSPASVNLTNSDSNNIPNINLNINHYPA